MNKLHATKEIDEDCNVATLAPSSSTSLSTLCLLPARQCVAQHRYSLLRANISYRCSTNLGVINSEAKVLEGKNP